MTMTNMSVTYSLRLRVSFVCYYALCRTTEAFLSVSQDERNLFLNNETAFHSNVSISFLDRVV